MAAYCCTQQHACLLPKSLLLRVAVLWHHDVQAQAAAFLMSPRAAEKLVRLQLGSNAYISITNIGHIC